MTRVSREVRLVRRPSGELADDDFEMVESPVRELREGEVLVRNQAVSVDPYMRLYMSEEATGPTWPLGEPMRGGAVGVVEESASARFAVGQTVKHMYGWREFAIVPEADLQPAPASPSSPLITHFGVLGMKGVSAWVALTRIGQLRAGETVFISGAAGPVGAIAGQAARLSGAARVIGSAGSQEKLDLLVTTYGFDDAFNYRDPDLVGHLRRAAPEGIDLYFDNVGGPQLDAALEVLNPRGRVVVCGVAADYNATADSRGPANWVNVLMNSIRIEGFQIEDHMDAYPEWIKTASAWVAEDKMKYEYTVIDGLENAVATLRELIRPGSSIVGKAVIRLDQDPVVAG